MVKYITTILLLLTSFYAFSDVISVADNQTYIIDENHSLNAERIEIGVNSEFTNNGEIIIDNLDMSYCYKSGASFINNGTIYCNSITMNINQWQWLANMFTFANYGNIICEGEIYLKLSARTNFILGENSIITCDKLTVEKYGNQDIELLGSIVAEEIELTVNDGGKIVRFGDIMTGQLTLRNNATNLSVDGFAYIETLTSNTWGSSRINVEGGLVIGDIDNNSNVIGGSDSFISLCMNPTSGKDFSLNSSGTVCYRIQYNDSDSYYWETSPKDENEITGQPTLKANFISYDECIEGQTRFLSLETFSNEKCKNIHKLYENVPEKRKTLKYGNFEYWLIDGELRFNTNRVLNQNNSR